VNKVKRLFEQLQPSEYNLHLTINEEAMTFEGTVSITGKKTGRPSKRITLHQKDLSFTSATITHKDKTGHKVKELARINTHAKFDEVRLHTHENLYPGHYEVSLAFTGKITRAMNGMYPCFYEENGVKKQFIATQFESHHAREVFPCIDEPEAKAVFNISITSRQTTVVSNTPVVSTTIVDGQQTTAFEPTPLMSTYLVAFVIGDMSYKEAKTKRGVTVRTYSTPDNIEYTDFALDTAIKCIEFYEGYFGIEYPLAKSDLLALPDFSSGAMENWGCITFREQCMLVDPKNTSLGTKQFVALVVAHELAHMWFGNLVTMRWWTDLWLNEGFASWVEYLAIDELFPEWQMWTQFIVDEQQQAMKLDSLDNTHPIEVPVHHPDEIRTIFDIISYSKGASVIHQLNAFIGADDFKKGLHTYLTRHAYKNTDTKDLWKALADASGKDIAGFMHAWTTNPGFPLVTATARDDQLRLQQKRFYSDPSVTQTSTKHWPVPLLSTQKLDHDLLHTHEIGQSYDKNALLLLNSERRGFYRTTYDENLLQLITQHIAQGKMSPLDRLGILNDLFETSKAGHTPTAQALTLLEQYKNEDNAVVWTTIAGMLGSIRLVHGNDQLRTAMKPFMRRLAAGEYKRLGWDKKKSDSYFDQLERPIILGLLAGSDDPDILQRCDDIFNKISDVEDVNPELRDSVTSSEMKRNLDIDPDTRGVIFSTVARRGDNKTFAKLVKLHNETHLSEEKLTFAAALTDFKQPELIQKSLAFIRSDEVRLQDVSYWIAYSFMNHHARTATWEWLKENWEWLQQNLGNDLSFYRMPLYAARVHSDVSFVEDYKAFFEPRMTPGLERSYKQGLEMISWQAAWRNRDQQAITDYFLQTA